MSVPINKTVIVGTGLIGASLAVAGKRAGSFSEVVGVGRGRGNLEAALEAGVVDAISQDLEHSVADADLVVLAAPVDACLDLLSRVAAAAPARTVISDVGSVKGPICRAAVELGIHRRFVGAHPMAGGTNSGSRHASADLFIDALVVVTPEAAEETSVASVVDVWRSIGARTIAIDAATHDRQVALISHLAQMLAFALSATAGGSKDCDLAAELAASGFRDTARLASSDVAMWQAIATLNSEHIVAAMDEFSRLWKRLRAAVAAGDCGELEAVARAANDFYERACK